MRDLLRTKSVADIAATLESGETGLRRTLNAFDLTMLGIGAVIGAGIFSTLGTAAVGEQGVRLGAGHALVVAHDSKIPQSTVYKKLHRLESLGLVYVEKIELINHVKSKHYRSMIRKAEISFKKFEPIIRLIPNKT